MLMDLKMISHILYRGCVFLAINQVDVMFMVIVGYPCGGGVVHTLPE